MSDSTRIKTIPRHRAKGFTLLELLVVMVIIGLLAGYVGPKYFSQIGKSEVKVARAQLDAFDKALDQYRLDTGRYPNTSQGLGALTSKPANEAKWDGPYLKINRDVPRMFCNNMTNRITRDVPRMLCNNTANTHVRPA